MTMSLTSILGSHSLAYSYWCCPVAGVLGCFYPGCASSLWQFVSAEEPLPGEQELREDNCRHGFTGRVVLWQLHVCWGLVSAQEDNLCMQQKGWTLVTDYIVSVYPHTVPTCNYIRQCKYSGVNHALKDSLLSLRYVGALLPQSSCCGILPIWWCNVMQLRYAVTQIPQSWSTTFKKNCFHQ